MSGEKWWCWGVRVGEGRQKIWLQWKRQSDGRNRLESCSLQMEKGLKVKESEWQLEAEKDKDMGSPLEFPEGSNPVNTLILCCAQSLQSWPTLCDRMDHSLLGSSVHGIFQARILEWVAISHSRESFWPSDGDWVSSVSCIDRWILYY